MSTKYLNGVGQTKFLITDENFVIKDTILLPLTNSKGLIETYEEKNIFYEFLNYKREKKILGYNVNFTLNFDEYVSKTTLLSIYKLLHWEYTFRLPAYSGYRIFIFPRVDVASRYFEVIGRNETMTLSVMKGGTKTMGHKGIVLNYTTKYLSNWGWADPANEDIIIIDSQNLLTI